MSIGGAAGRSKKIGYFIVAYLVVTIIIAISFFIIILVDYKSDSATYQYAATGGGFIILGGIAEIANVYNALIKKDRIVLSYQTLTQRESQKQAAPVAAPVATYAW